MPWQRARTATARMWATGAREGAHSSDNGRGGPTLVTDACRNDNGNSNVWRGPAPTLGKDSLYGTDIVAGVAADKVECCQK